MIKSFEGAYHEVATNIFANALLDSEIWKKMKQAGSIWRTPKIFADETDSVDKFIVPGVTPFKAISRLAARSFGGSDHPGSLFNFYQTNKVFHFSNNF